MLRVLTLTGHFPTLCTRSSRESTLLQSHGFIFYSRQKKLIYTQKILLDLERRSTQTQNNF